MSAKLRLATPDDAMRLDRLVSACHEELSVPMSEEDRLAALSPLLSGEVPGAAYLIGPPSSPVGYILLRFGYALRAGGLVARIDELYIRPPVRGRGMASEAIHAVAKQLRTHGLRAVEAVLPEDVPEKLFRRLLFREDGGTALRLDL
ncbi:GNAT family N-acetyltransferase [Palleronia sp. LCG004]|uniref:GNAT family N-acetyltransferase n=1 Tax=Palleronia sp. LCG004 TaxID=3079304 RepID=UPI00294352D7|nr:GNAT family N-acetyltransferase [Palleronia sp. LCG004]WOI54992.1 GNAT family N-acetyltransferase [Palleronia sp. LCG004]